MRNEPSTFGFKLGDKVKIPDAGIDYDAEVTGVDRYTEKTAAGGVNSWISYTLDAPDAPAGSRWKHFWAVDGQAPRDAPGQAFLRRSFYVAAAGDTPPAGFVLDRDLSGFVELKSEGNAALSGGPVAQGALFTYRNAAGQVWAEETFTGAGRLTFEAVFEGPEPG